MPLQGHSADRFSRRQSWIQLNIVDHHVRSLQRRVLADYWSRYMLRDLHRGYQLLRVLPIMKGPWMCSALALRTPILGRQTCVFICSLKCNRNRYRWSHVTRMRHPSPRGTASPCSVHDLEAAYDYAQRLRSLVPEVERSMTIIMREPSQRPSG